MKVFDRKDNLIRRHKSQQLLDFENTLNGQLGPYVGGLVKYLEVKSTYNMFLHVMEPAKGSILQVRLVILKVGLTFYVVNAWNIT